MKKILLFMAALFAVLTSSNAQTLSPPNLGAAREYAVLGSNAVTSTGSSVLYGDLGTSPGTLVAGFPTGRVLGETARGTAAAATAKAEVARVYNELGQLPAARTLTGQTLGEGFTPGDAAVRGTTLTRGVYKIDGDARLSGRLKFDGQGNPNSVFIIQVNGDLVIDPGSAINVFNASPNNVFFRVTGNVTIGTGGMLGTPSTLAGNLVAQKNILLSLGTTLVGRALSTTGDITLNNNNISLPEPISSGDGGDGTGGGGPGGGGGGGGSGNANLRITKSVNGTTFTLGETVTYTITITNSGASDALNVTVEDKLPAGLELVPPVETDKGTYDANTGVWTIGTLPANQTATLRIAAKTTALGEITNVAVIGGGGDSDEATICVRPARPNVVGLQAICVGGSTTYTVSNISAGVTSLAIVAPEGSGISVEARTLTSFTLRASATTAPGTYSVTVVAVAAGNCQNSLAFPIELVVNAAPVAPVITGPTTAVCAGSTYQYSISQPVAGVTYTWTVSGEGWERIGATTGTQIQVKAGTGSGSVTVVANNACGSATASTPQITPAAVPAVPVILDNSGPCTGLTYAISNPVAGVTYTWTAPAGFTFADNSTTTTGTNVTLKATAANAVGTLTVAANVAGAFCASDNASVEVRAADAGTEIVVPTVFSPNGDGINDTFVIRNLLNFPDNELTLYNRWGNEIYKTKSYKNDWQATGLEEATYFYVLRVRGCDGKDQVFRGPVQVVR
ncbi:ice-binding family protein [Rufibacter psychrotolerans]|uniref:ice-binding family protein n=1 Tax=Rufibacter psychrotolerans TaxID=2812556 RepID=UPI001968137D|nr:ice-binding family protein [Rufibacter sp. SYSU D00308]